MFIRAYFVYEHLDVFDRSFRVVIVVFEFLLQGGYFLFIIAILQHVLTYLLVFTLYHFRQFHDLCC